MPDGDRFFRRLAGTGIGWKKAYALAWHESAYLSRAAKCLAGAYYRIASSTNDLSELVFYRGFQEIELREISFSSINGIASSGKVSQQDAM
jgi:hypothetical protein